MKTKWCEVTGRIDLAGVNDQDGSRMVNLVELATRVKSARKGKGMTLDDLAERSGLAKGVLSKVENFRVTPSLPSIIKIASALEIPLDKLFEGLDRKPETSIVRKGESKEVERDSEESSIRYFDLAHLRPNRRMDPFELIVPSGGGRLELKTHEGEEFLRVLEGDVLFELSEKIEKLSADDSVYFDAEIPHRIWNESKKEARVLCVFLGNRLD